MVNKILEHIPRRPLTLVHGGVMTQPKPAHPAPERQDLFIDDRSRILITTLAANKTVDTVCHIHASKQITVLDGYAEVELPDTCVKLFEGQSTNIPNGIAHKIVNFGKIPLKYVEIRTGPYVMDDDQLA